MRFTTEIQSKDVMISNYPLAGNDWDVEAGTFFVEWDFEYETRRYGVKDIYAIVQSVRGTITLLKPNFEEDLDFTDEGWNIESSVKVEGNTIYPNYIEIDFKDKIIYVS